MVDRNYADLIDLTAEMAHGSGMPSEHWDDHPWQKTTGINERRRVLREAAKANDQCRDWAVRLRAIADRLSKQHNSAPETP